MPSLQEENITINDLINKFRDLYNLGQRITLSHQRYLAFKDELTKFIYSNYLNNTLEWETIYNNLVIKTTQYMSVGEFNIILTQLEKLQLIILENKNESFWQYIHPVIKELVFIKYNSKQYADAVESAFKEVNSRLKKIYRKYYKHENSNKELDGKNLMEYLFSLSGNRLKFEDTSTESGENVQVGYMQIFSGAISGIRNPKAHENLTLTKEKAIKRLILASLLMDKIDEAVEYSNIME